MTKSFMSASCAIVWSIACLVKSLWCVKLLPALGMRMNNFSKLWKFLSLCKFDGKLLPETFLWCQLIYCLVGYWIISDCNKTKSFEMKLYCRFKKIHGVKNENEKSFQFQRGKFKSDLYDSSFYFYAISNLFNVFMSKFCDKVI